MRALRSGGKYWARVLAAQRFAQRAFDHRHATLPARTVFGHAGQGLAVEVEALVDEGLRQVRRVFAQQLPLEVGLDGGQVGLASTSLKPVR
jgi:hypothetical protein